jgi:HSP20 family protein
MAHHMMHFDPLSDIARFDPMRSMDDFLKDMGFKDALKDFGRPSPIRLDVTESEQAYLIKAELPGFKVDDISVDIDGNRVSISAESRQEHEETNGQKVVRRERHTGQYFRSFSLAQDIDADKAVARYRDGVLDMELPKLLGGSAKRLQIS